MRVVIRRWNAAASWRWDIDGKRVKSKRPIIRVEQRSKSQPTSKDTAFDSDNDDDGNDDDDDISDGDGSADELAGDDDDDDICGICQNAYESTCSNDCALPGDGCPLVWGDCSHVFHKHCLTKWLDSSNKGQCPLDRQPWVTKIST